MKKGWSVPSITNLEVKLTEKSPSHGSNIDAVYVDDSGTNWYSYSA